MHQLTMFFILRFLLCKVLIHICTYKTQLTAYYSNRNDNNKRKIKKICNIAYGPFKTFEMKWTKIENKYKGFEISFIKINERRC